MEEVRGNEARGKGHAAGEHEANEQRQGSMRQGKHRKWEMVHEAQDPAGCTQRRGGAPGADGVREHARCRSSWGGEAHQVLFKLRGWRLTRCR